MVTVAPLVPGENDEKCIGVRVTKIYLEKKCWAFIMEYFLCIIQNSKIETDFVTFYLPVFPLKRELESPKLGGRNGFLEL